MNVAFGYVLAGAAEILACTSYWRWSRLRASPLWLTVALFAVAAFVGLFAWFDLPEARRAFPVFMGLYVLTWFGWVGTVERRKPAVGDLVGGGLLLAVMAALLLYNL